MKHNALNHHTNNKLGKLGVLREDQNFHHITTTTLKQSLHAEWHTQPDGFPKAQLPKYGHLITSYERIFYLQFWSKFMKSNSYTYTSYNVFFCDKHNATHTNDH